MLPARAAKRNRQITLALANVMRQKIDQQLRNPADEFLGLRERPDILRNLGIAPGQRTKLRHKMRIRQEANVKHQIRVLRHSMLEAEAHAGDQNVIPRRLLLKTLVD